MDRDVACTSGVSYYLYYYVLVVGCHHSTDCRDFCIEVNRRTPWQLTTGDDEANGSAKSSEFHGGKRVSEARLSALSLLAVCS